jgi:pimeloyl-ACP methyl ester carboxylesterase
MPHISARDGTRLYYEESGQGIPVIFVHEYAGDYRTWEMQMRFFSRAHRCVTYSQRGYPPSDVPSDGAKYSQDIARDDVIALMDALKIDRAHVVGPWAPTPPCMSASMPRRAASRSWLRAAGGAQRRTRKNARK